MSAKTRVACSKFGRPALTLEFYNYAEFAAAVGMLRNHRSKTKIISKLIIHKQFKKIILPVHKLRLKVMSELRAHYPSNAFDIFDVSHLFLNRKTRKCLRFDSRERLKPISPVQAQFTELRQYFYFSTCL